MGNTAKFNFKHTSNDKQLARHLGIDVGLIFRSFRPTLSDDEIGTTTSTGNALLPGLNEPSPDPHVAHSHPG